MNVTKAMTPSSLQHEADGDFGIGKFRHRTDIQGMRALAVLAVITFHARLFGLQGGFIGVDFFFVLSGYLITFLLLREGESKGRIALVRFWSRRARRLIPASVLVIAVTLFASWRLLALSDRRPVTIDAIFSLFFSANWRFAQQETEYLALGRNPSPYLHFWSLGVEEQFYFVWPVLLGMLIIVVRRKHARRAIATLVIVALVASFLYGMFLTVQNQPFAYFGTHSRAWQLLAGALLAVFSGLIAKVSCRIGLGLSFAGLALFVLSLFLLRESGAVMGFQYPSFLALMPTGAAVLLIAGGSGKGHVISRFLSLKPLVRIGDVSYSLYLWHWPVLVLGPYLWGNSISARLFYVGVAFVLAFLTYRLIEDPIRRSRFFEVRPKFSIVAGLGSLCIVAGVAIAGLATQLDDVNSLKKSEDLEKVRTDVNVSDAQKLRMVGSTRALTSTMGEKAVKPALSEAPRDFSKAEVTCQASSRGGLEFELPALRNCTFGAVDSDRTIVLTGDSTAGALAPGVIAAAEEQGWRVVIRTMSKCSFAQTAKEDGSRPDLDRCAAYRKVIDREIQDLKPELVIVVNSYYSHLRSVRPYAPLETVEQEMAFAAELIDRRASRLQELGINVALVSSPVQIKPPPVDCLAETRDSAECHFPTAVWPDAMKLAFERNERSFFVDTTSTYCGTDCYPIIRDRIVYRDDVHFTQSFARDVLSPLFGDLLQRVP